MNPIFLPPVMGEIEQTRFFNHGMVTSLGERKLNSKPVVDLERDGLIHE